MHSFLWFANANQIGVVCIKKPVQLRFRNGQYICICYSNCGDFKYSLFIGEFVPNLAALHVSDVIFNNKSMKCVQNYFLSIPNSPNFVRLVQSSFRAYTTLIFLTF